MYDRSSGGCAVLFIVAAALTLLPLLTVVTAVR